MSTHSVLRQRDWTETELQAAGFYYYAPRKRLVMARMIKEVTNVELTLETLLADPGDIICYSPGDTPRSKPDEYDHWPVQRDLFRKTYKPWDEADWKPNPAEAHLMLHGCRPYFKWVGIWALQLPISIYVQSLESPEPVIVPKGRWLCIGSQGEPYNMADESIQQRYLIPPNNRARRSS